MRYKLIKNNKPNIRDLDLTCFSCRRAWVDYEYAVDYDNHNRIWHIYKCRNCGTWKMTDFVVMEYSEWEKKVTEDIKNEYVL